MMQGSRVGRRPPRAVIQNPTHRLPAIMSLRASLSIKFKLKSELPSIDSVRS